MHASSFSSSLLINSVLAETILTQYATRTNNDQFKMLTWNGVTVEGAEDDSYGVQSDYPQSPLPPLLEFEAKPHPENRVLELARKLFSTEFIAGDPKDWWWDFSREEEASTEWPREKGAMKLDQFIDNELSFETLNFEIIF